MNEIGDSDLWSGHAVGTQKVHDWVRHCEHRDCRPSISICQCPGATWCWDRVYQMSSLLLMSGCRQVLWVNWVNMPKEGQVRTGGFSSEWLWFREWPCAFWIFKCLFVLCFCPTLEIGVKRLILHLKHSPIEDFFTLFILQNKITSHFCSLICTCDISKENLLLITYNWWIEILSFLNCAFW